MKHSESDSNVSQRDEKLNEIGELLDETDSYSIRTHLSKLTYADLIFLYNAIEKQLNVLQLAPNNS